MTGISVLVASAGERRSLRELAWQITAQLVPGDELIVDVNVDGSFGHAARNQMMRRAKQDNWLWFLDDDDLPAPDALKVIRWALAETRTQAPHLFRMRYHDSVIWRTPEVIQGNVSTQMIVVPRTWGLCARWGLRYEGDFDFVCSLARQGPELIWRPETIVTYNGLAGR
jgi:hypothetical protein